MREMMLLTKTLLKANFGFSKLIYDIKKDPKKAGVALVIVLVFASLIPVYILYIRLLESVYFQLFILGQEGTLFAILFSGASIVVLFFGLIYAMSTFYFSKDLERLLYLPLKEENIVAAKFFNMVFYEYLIIIPLMIPAFFIPFSDMGGVPYIVYWVLGVLLVPIIPLSIGTILVMGIMRFVSIEGKKDTIRIISLFLFLVVVIGLQVLINRAATSLPPGGEAAFLADILRNSNSLVNVVGRSYPPAVWISKALFLDKAGAGFLQFLLYAGTSVAFLIGTIWTGKALYVNGYYNKSDAVKKTVKVDYEKGFVQTSVWKAVFLNDFRVVMRTPIYLFNCVSIVVLLPVLLFLMPLLSGGMDMTIFAEIPPGYEYYIGLVLIGVFVFMGGTNPTQSTTVSREGKSAWVQQVLPISKRDAFIGRILLPLLLQVLTMVFMLIGVWVLVKPSLSIILISFIGGFFISLPLLAAGIIVDTMRPKLDWDDPQKAVKQNFNVFINMILAAAYGALLGFLAIQAMGRLGLDWTVVIGIYSVLGCILSWALYKLYAKVDTRR